VHVHPLDLPLVADGAAESLQARGARLLARPDIARGGVVVESDLGAIDARIATRWAQAAAALGTQEPWSVDEGGSPGADATARPAATAAQRQEPSPGAGLE
jgi:flagellar assembly protein FliH